MGNAHSKSWQKIARPWILRKLGERGRQRLQVLTYYTILIMAGIGCRQRLGNERKETIDRQQNAAVVETQTKNPFRRQMERWSSFLKKKITLISVENAAKARHVSNVTDTHRESYKDISIKEYENRLRHFSTPEKIFAYFATIKTKNEANEWEIYMTPIDFLRAVMPGLRQPEGLGLNRYRRMTKEEASHLSFQIVPKDTIFYQLRPNGLLSFGDYLYLWMIMKLSKRYFKIGFRLFDKSGTQNVNSEGLNFILLNVSENERFKAHSAVNRFLFGPHGKNTISLENFLKFKKKLTHDVLLIEFNLLLQKDLDQNGNQKFENKISEFALAERLLTYSCQSTLQKIHNLRRIKKKYGRQGVGISLDDFLTFHYFLQNVSVIDAALEFYYLAGADISQFTLKHTSQIVLGKPLSPDILKILYAIFDLNNDGILSRDEFSEIMRSPMSHYRKKKWNPSKLFRAIWKCAHQSY